MSVTARVAAVMTLFLSFVSGREDISIVTGRTVGILSIFFIAAPPKT